MAPRSHALLSPSAVTRWSRCPASVVMTHDLPDENSPAALEGSIAHAVAESILTCKIFKAPEGAPENIDIEQFARDVQPYVRYVNLRTGGTVCLIETEVDLSWLGEEKAHGTSDCVIISANKLWVVDLKYGKGIKVPAQNNLQLAIYARSAWEMYSAIFEVDNPEIIMTIVQPRINHEDTWKIDLKELIRITDELKPAAQEALEEYREMQSSEARLDRLTFNPGEEQCRWCKYRSKCSALARYSLTAAGIEMKELCGKSAVDLFDLSGCLSHIPAIKIWIKAIEERARDELQAGKHIPGWKLVRGKAGPRKWSDSKSAEEILKAAGVSPDLYHTSELITPTAAEKLVKGKKIDVEVWKKLQATITRSEGALNVAAEDDERDAVSPSGLTAADYPDESKREVSGK